MAKFSINPHIIPGNMPKEEHFHLIRTGVAAAVIMLVIGLAYYLWGMPQEVATTQQPVVVSPQDIKEQVLTALQQSTTTTLSQPKINQVVTSLKKATTTITTTQKQSIINALK